ncbi:MAG: succinate dehydrogenase cytochrome b subunit, partial [Anaerolineae bacterium]|nr:succinate dehydrogenase cytochrome b subunit [Anaerolineae bacterium]
SLTQQSRTARPKSYAHTKRLRTNAASLYMRYGGVFILLFIIFHLMHFTWGWLVHPDFIQGEPYHNVITGFTSLAYIPVVIYLIGLVALALHLYHGAWSMFQTLGLNNKTYTDAIRLLAWALAIIIPLGFAVVPLAVVFGIVS